jgi:polysaccharide pyruvyl transferase WcaK-like protein
MKKIGIFGYYKYGNFGDDLMAYMFHKYLKESGHEVRVWGLVEEIASKRGVKKENNIKKLVEWSDCIVYGGGGVLIPKSGKSDFGRHLNELIHYKSEMQVPLYAISIGGDSTSTMSNLKSPRKQLVEKADFITFRNPKDRLLAKSAGVENYRYYPDVVFSSERFFTKKDRKKDRNPPKVLVELSSTDSRKTLYALLAALKTFAGINCRSIELKHASISKNKSKNLANLKNKILENKEYHNLREIVDMCGENSIVFTSRLHLGLCNMCLGGTTFLVDPNDKSKILFERMGLDRYIIERLSSFVNTIVDIGYGKKYTLSYQKEDLKKIKQNKQSSEGHFEALDRIIRD